jgi:hypothetical protein
MDLSDMRKQFRKGAFEAALVAPAPMESNAWIFIVQRTDGKQEHMTIARSDRQKIYKSLDAVRADVERVGFKDVRWMVA